MGDHFELKVPGARSSSRVANVMSPYDESKLGSVQTADGPVVEQALSTAQALYRDRDSWIDAASRLAILERTAALMAARHEELAAGAAAEGGKPLMDSRVEVTRAIDGVKLCVEGLRRQAGREIPMSLGASSANRLAVTRREPIGVVVAVSAFNHPLNLIVHQVGPAVAAGCPSIVKPAEDTPLSCFRFIDILREAGLPDEWCQPVLTADHGVTEQLVTDNRNAFFSFIGSARVGWMLRSKLAAGTRCALEHGGVAPAIVTADADLDQALPLLAKGGFYHAGQVCVSVQRVFVENTIVKGFSDRLVEIASQLIVGDPGSDKTEVGPLIRSAEVDRIEQWVNEAVASGAQLLCGGKRLENNCFAPTVLLDPPAAATISRNEVFGPVVCVYSYDDLDDAIAQANDLDVAFHAAVFTRNIDLAMRAYRRLDASAVMVNDHTAFRVDWMPFAGLRHSGLGIGGIEYTLHDMQVEKMLLLKSAELR